MAERTSLPLSALPTCFSIVVRSSRGPSQLKFLYLRGGHAKKEDHATFREMELFEPLTSSMNTRFYVVPSKKHGDEQLVHIRTSYNNKYLVARLPEHVDKESLPNHLEVPVDTVDEPEEELSNPSCTLFKVQLEKLYQYSNMPTDCQVRFFHPLWKIPCVFVSDVFMPEFDRVAHYHYGKIDVVDVSAQIILPPYVAFKGDNGLYLRVVDSESEPYLEFASSDKADTSATFTTFNYADGRVCIKSELNKKLLGLTEDEWIWAHSKPEENEDPGYTSMFRASKFDDFFVLQNGFRFCTRSKKGNRDCFSAGAETITDNAKLWLEEPVLSRDIYNIEYHRNDHARIYDTTDMNMATASAINRTSGPNTVKSSLSITTTDSSKWESTSTHKGNVSVSISGGFSFFDLFKGNYNVQGGYEYTKAQTWGNASQTEKKQQIEYEVTVPANKKVTLTVTAKQAKYDVPFSYTQRDRLHNGETRIDNYDDGLYSGMNWFDLRYETKEEEIETKEEVLQILSKKRKAMIK